MTITAKDFYLSLIIASLISGCGLINKVKKDIFIQSAKRQDKILVQKQVSISCGKGDIKQYRDKGWKIITKSTKEITCKWKTKRAKPGCNLDLDKGCKIVVPDKKGKEVIYLIEREVDSPRQ